MSESSVLITKTPRGVATVAINRPNVRNAIDDNVIHLLTDAFKTLDADGETRIVVLTGSGVAFSAGADLDWMRRMAALGEAENFASAKTISAMLRALNELAKPTIARINGAAYAAGVGLVAACDIVVARSGVCDLRGAHRPRPFDDQPVRRRRHRRQGSSPLLLDR
jgi:methylglutaconyl-CoA hydratase